MSLFVLGKGLNNSILGLEKCWSLMKSGGRETMTEWTSQSLAETQTHSWREGARKCKQNWNGAWIERRKYTEAKRVIQSATQTGITTSPWRGYDHQS
jgi:hypothetical protein